MFILSGKGMVGVVTAGSPFTRVRLAQRSSRWKMRCSVVRVSKFSERAK
ncbi:MAG: hypothetical protein M2R45_01176 [Verrucomicrobia subdivision 3 bacterium]|nr:hypothetical protein [Limisphaerales bacterium]MCS1415271.1 hypothetical protein [Limisphaerales bacterium]